MIFEHIDEHNESLSKKIQYIVDNVKEMETKEQQNQRQFKQFKLVFVSLSLLFFFFFAGGRGTEQNQEIAWRLLLDEICIVLILMLAYIVMSFIPVFRYLVSFISWNILLIGIHWINCVVRLLFGTNYWQEKLDQSMYSP